jgi:outer membrane protein OmpA-like peptidoglycan-associated protein
MYSNMLFRSLVKSAIVLLLLLAGIESGRAQNSAEPVASVPSASVVDNSDLYSRRVSFGAVADANLNEHFTAFKYLPGVPSCSPEFTHGSGFGGAFGIAANIPLSGNFSFGVRGVYSINSATLKASEATAISVGGVGTPATIDHSIAATLGLINLEPTINYTLFGQLHCFAGVGVGYLLQKQFAQKEVLSQPTDFGAFENGSRTRNVVQGTLPDAASILGSIVGGITYELPLNASGTLHALPELGWSQFVTPLVKGLPWNMAALSAGVSIMYTLPVEPPPPVIKPVAPPPPPPAAKIPALLASVTASGVDPDGTEHSTATLKVEEIYETHTAPIVPYVFFEDADSALPTRYVQLSQGERASFKTSDLYHSDRLSLYHQILNIIGSRLVADPNAEITLIGCNSNVGAELNAKNLSKARAKTVAGYLETVWNIPADRIHIQSRDLPQSFSPRNDTDGIAENRRVEIASDDPGMLAPLTLADTIRDATPPIIRFHPTTTAEAGVRNWKLTASQDNHDLRAFEGNGTVPKTVEWDLDHDQTNIPRAPGRLDYSLNVTDSIGQSVHAADTLQVDQRTLRTKKRQLVDNAEIEHYSLLLFNFKSAELSPNDRAELNFIKKRITKRSTVTVAGYCDRIGDVKANHVLATQRANAAAQILGTEGVQAVGQTELLYDNATPEARFYSRTVEVTIKTPLEHESN